MVLLMLKGVLKNKSFKSILNNFSWMFLLKITELASSFVLGVVLARYFGAENYGVYSVILAVTTVCSSLSTFGLNHLVTKEIKNANKPYNTVIGHAIYFRIFASLLCFLLVYFFAELVVSDSIAPFLYLILGAQVFTSFKVVEYFFLASSNMKPFIILNVSNNMIFLLVKILVIYFDGSLEDILVTLAIENLTVGLGSLLVYKFKASEGIRFSIDKYYSKNLFKMSFPLVLSSLTAIIYLKIDILMLSYFSSKESVGVYAVASRLSEVWYVLPTLISSAVFPKILELKSKNHERYLIGIQKMLDFLSASAFLLSVFITIFASLIIDILFGSEYSESALVLRIHIWASVFIFMRAIASKWFIAEDLYYMSFVTHGAGAIINVLLNYFLIPTYGPVGAAVATVFSYAAASYFSLFLAAKGRPLAYAMTKAIFWPRYIFTYFTKS